MLIVERNEPTRLGLALVLRREPWVAHCLIAADVERAASLAARHRPAVAVLEISDAGPFAAAATARLRDAHPGVAIVLTSRCASVPPAAPRSLGATAFLPPTAPSAEIAAAVHAAALALDYGRRPRRRALRWPSPIASARSWP